MLSLFLNTENPRKAFSCLCIGWPTIIFSTVMNAANICNSHKEAQFFCNCIRMFSVLKLKIYDPLTHELRWHLLPFSHLVPPKPTGHSQAMFDIPTGWHIPLYKHEWSTQPNLLRRGKRSIHHQIAALIYQLLVFRNFTTMFGKNFIVQNYLYFKWRRF